MRQTLTDDFWDLHKNMDSTFPSKKVFFPKSKKSQNRYQFTSRFFKLSQEKMFNNNTI